MRRQGLQHARLPSLHYLPEFAHTHVHWVNDAIQPSLPVTPFFFCPQSFPTLRSFPMSQLFTSGGQSIGASALASVLSMNIQGWFHLGLTTLMSFEARDPEESSPAPQSESINSSPLLYGLTLTSVHDYWKKTIADYMHLCWQSDVSAF